MTADPANRRLKILHLTTRLLPGGADEHTLITLEGLPSDRYEFALGYGPDHDARQVARAGRAGVTTRCFPTLYNWPAPRTDPALIVNVARWIRRERFDIVHTHETKAGFVGRIAGLLARAPCIVHTCHGFGFGALGSRPMDHCIFLLEWVCSRWTHRIAYVSGRLMEQAVAMGIGRRSRSLVIRSGKDIEHYRGPSARAAEREAREGRGDRPLTISCTARLTPNKGLEDLIESAVMLAPEFPGLRVWIIGDGPLRPDLEGLISARGIADTVSLLGMRKDVPDLLAEVDIAVLASLREGLPQSLTEAMIAGKAVVATPVGGVPEVVRDGETGLLVPAGRPAELAAAIRRLLVDGPLRRALGERASAELSAEFDKRRMLEKYDLLYRELCRERVARRRQTD